MLNASRLLERMGIRAKLILIFVAIKVVPLVLLAGYAWQAYQGLGEGVSARALQMAEAMRITQQQTGKTANDDAATQKTYLHRGLAERDFERRFQLADYVVVTDANLVNGLLTITLKRELPEALKPRRVEIGVGQPLIEGEMETTAKAA